MTALSAVAITGATGYLGSILTSHLSVQADTVIALTRRRPADPTIQWRPFDLGQAIDETALEGIDTLIHAAWVLGGKDQHRLWAYNVIGSRRLLETAVAVGVPKIVFLSSMSAYYGTRQTYGLMKLAVERTALDAGTVVVRPGLVYGDSPGGMAGTLSKVAKLPLWPRFRAARQFLAHEEDVASAMATVLDEYRGLQGQILGFAHSRPLELQSILTGLAPSHRRRPQVPVPAGLVMTALRVLESANFPLPFRSDSLLGLVEPAEALPGQQLLAERGIDFRAFSTDGDPR